MKIFIVELSHATYLEPRGYVVVANNADECRELVYNNIELPKDADISSIEEKAIEPGIIFIEYIDG